MKRRRLTKLKWDEISGVDAGANETPGFVLQKSKKLSKDAEKFEETVVKAAELVGTDEVKLYFADADDKVKKALDTVLKHFEEGLEEEKSDDDSEDDLVEKVAKRISKLLKGDSGDSSGDDEDESDEDDESGDSEDEDESGDADKDDESDDESGEDEDENVSKKSDKDDKQTLDAEGLAKGLAEALGKELEPIKEAIVAIADRTENLEKASAGSSALSGQDEDGSEDDKDKKDSDSLSKAFAKVIKTGEKLTLS